MKKIITRMCVCIAAIITLFSISNIASAQTSSKEKVDLTIQSEKQLRNFFNDIARGNENKKPSIFRDDSVGAVTNQKDCSPAKDTHPTEDNPEQIEKDENLEGVRNALEDGRTVFIGYNKVEECGDHSAIIAKCCKNIAISRDEAEIIERCTKNGTELHYSEKNGFTYTNMFGDEMPIICLRGMCQVFTDEEIKNMKK